MGFRSSLALSLLLLSACMLDAPATLPPGQWSGDGLNLFVTPDTTRIETLCGGGLIARPLHLDTKGRFAVEVTMVDIGFVTAVYDVTLTGDLNATLLEVTLQDLAPNSSPRSYWLQRRSAPHLGYCG
jgi:hypothetical protein